MRWKQNAFRFYSSQTGRDILLNTAVQSSAAASICMLKSSFLSEVPAPAVISIWAEGTESESQSVFDAYGEEAQWMSMCQHSVKGGPNKLPDTLH